MALLIDIAGNHAPARRRGAWSLIAGVMLMLLGILHAATSAIAVEDSPQILEQRVKAAFLFKFGGYVEWPDSAFSSKDAPLVIGVAGNDLLAEELSQVVAGRTMNGRAVSIRRIRGDLPASVHVLFVGRTETGRLADLAAQARPILIVTDTEKGLAQGSIINFVVADNRVRFEVSLEAAKRSGLRIGAPLLSVAMRVQG
ncbi:MAG TPA: YfiR family protein [Burkholderiales bacterium]